MSLHPRPLERHLHGPRFQHVDRTSLFTNAVLLTNGVFDGRPEYAKDTKGAYRFATGGAYRAGTNTFMDGVRTPGCFPWISM